MFDREGQNRKLLRALGDADQSMAHPFIRPGLWLSAFSIGAFILWAQWAEIEEITRGEGRVVPFSRVQKIQSLEGGILKDLLVKEGDQVSIGQVVAQLDHTRFYSSYMEGQSQARSLRAAIARLQAEVKGMNKITFPEEVKVDSHDAETERALFQARRDKKREALAALEEEINMAQQRLTIIEPLVNRRTVSQVEALRLRQDIAFLAPGMPARVKITAYDYTIYGDLEGTLEQISADTIQEDTAYGKEYYYNILVRTQKNHLEHNGKVLPIKPGMVAEVDVLSGKRTVLSYLLKPMLKARLY